jgi:hypothetical protein
MKLKWMIGAAAFALLAACGETTKGADAPEVSAPEASEVDAAPEVKAEPAEAPGVDYSYQPNWLCHPETAGNDACAVDLTTTIVKGGTEEPLTEIETFEAAEDPAFDCFYLYPTVSTDAAGNSDLTPDAAEIRVTNVQFARFASVCRQYAPIYRQVTLQGLRDRMTGNTDAFDEQMAFEDASDAFNYYMENENNGRGVILIGHSQGARMIDYILKNDVIGKPAENNLISAMPIGYTYVLDRETQTYEGMPLCESKEQTACLISYVTFRADEPPPLTSWFGLVMNAETQAACVNPGALTGDGELKPYLSNLPDLAGNAPDFAGDAAEVTTPFATLPGLLTAECVEKGPHTYLAVTTHADPSDPRTDRVAGDVYINGEVAKDWGLHLGDMHLAMGNLIEIAEAQGNAWVAAHSD